MAQISVEIDLDEFDQSDIMKHVVSLIKRNYIDEDYLNEIVNSWVSRKAKTKISLDDQIKIDHFFKVFTNYTSAEIESLIPEK